MKHIRPVLLIITMLILGIPAMRFAQPVRAVLGDVQLDLSSGGSIIGSATTTVTSNIFYDDSSQSYYLDPGGSTSLVTAGSASIGNAMTITGSLTANGAMNFGNGVGDTVTANTGAWTFSNDTNLVLSGGINGMSFDTDTLSIDATNNRVGIGTTSPSYELHIIGNSALTAAENNIIYATGAQTTANTNIFTGIKSSPTYSAASGNTLVSLVGVKSYPENTNSGTVSNSYGGDFRPTNSSSGAATNMFGLIGIPINSGTGAVTTAIGLYVRVDDTNASGTITNGYGVYIEDSSETQQITNDYGLYQVDTGAVNYFGGSVGIGVTIPYTPLEVRSPGASADVFTATYADSSPLFKINEGTGTNGVVTLYHGATANIVLNGSTTTDSYINTQGLGLGMTSASVMLDVTGSIEYTGTITDVSDIRLKKNIIPVSGREALTTLTQTQAKSFTMADTGKREYGFIAQDIQPIFPVAISVTDPEKGYLGVNYLSFLPLATESIKELSRIISDQQHIIDSLSSRLEALEKKVQ